MVFIKCGFYQKRMGIGKILHDAQIKIVKRWRFSSRLASRTAKIEAPFFKRESIRNLEPKWTPAFTLSPLVVLRHSQHTFTPYVILLLVWGVYWRLWEYSIQFSSDPFTKLGLFTVAAGLLGYSFYRLDTQTENKNFEDFLGFPRIP